MGAWSQRMAMVACALAWVLGLRCLAANGYMPNVSGGDFVTFQQDQDEAAEALAGDVNGDGSVDVADYLILSAWLAGETGEQINEAAADMNRDGRIDSLDVVLLGIQVPALCSAAEITLHPAGTYVCAGSSATFTVVARGTAPLSYQWYQGPKGTTTTPVGINSRTYSTPWLTANTTYWVRVTNACGRADSNAATAKVNPVTTITKDPHDKVIVSGETAELSVTATGTGLSYQWYEGAGGTTTKPVGANSATYTTPALTATTQYWCRVTGACGSADSAAATVAVGGALVGPDATVGNLRYIPAGAFTQGSPSDEPGQNPSDPGRETQFYHLLTKAFALMETEVTRQMWADLKALQPTLPSDPTDTVYGAGATNPVQNVSWYEAVLFANLLSVQNGYGRCYYTDATFLTPITVSNYTAGPFYCDWSANGYRLPTEGEWERACRAETTTPFWVAEPNYTQTHHTGCAGGEMTMLELVAWFCANASPYRTKAVGGKAASPWNLEDVHGNVCEWCWDWSGSYPAGSATDYRGAGTGSQRVNRGGGWRSDASFCRSAVRFFSTPGYRDNDLGFRLVRGQ